MIRLKTMWELKDVDHSDDFVFVESKSRYFRLFNGEWIEKLYYTRKEIAMITGQQLQRITKIMIKLGMKFKGEKRNTYSNTDLMLVIKALRKLDEENKNFDQVKKEMGLKYHDEK
jgi:3-deoxy-D-manno-octulosonate 8-phosphate phosphatase KdsC-like HAD superfamily phosphatase